MIPVHKVPESNKTGIIWYDMKESLDRHFNHFIVGFEFQDRSFFIPTHQYSTTLPVYMYILEDSQIEEEILLFKVDCSEISVTDYAVYQFIQDILRTYNLDLIHDKTLETIKQLDQIYWMICQIKHRFPEFIGLDVQKNLESFDKLGASFQKIKEFYELLDTSLQNP